METKENNSSAQNIRATRIQKLTDLYNDIELLREKHGIEYVKRVTSVLFRNREIVFEPFDDNQFNPIKFLCERFFELQTEANRVMKDGRLVADVALHYYDISDDYLKSTNMHNNKPK